MSTIAERRRAQAAAISVLEELCDQTDSSTTAMGLRARSRSALRHLTSPDQLHDLLTELLSVVASLPAGAMFQSNQERSGSGQVFEVALDSPRTHAREGFYSALAHGRLIPSAMFRSSSGLSSSALSRAVREGRLFFVELDGIRAFPSFYLDRRYRLRDLEQVAKRLQGMSGGAKWLFFVMPKGSLSRGLASTSHANAGDAVVAEGSGAAAGADAVSLRTPLQAIEDGDIELVLRTATGYAES